MAEEYIHSLAALLFAFSTFSATVRLDYNCAFAMLAFFFVNNDSTKYSFNPEQRTVFLWLCVFSCLIDFNWILTHWNMGEVYNHSTLHKLSGSMIFVIDLSIIEFVFIKIPFVMMLCLVNSSGRDDSQYQIPAHDVQRWGQQQSYRPNVREDQRSKSQQIEKPWDMSEIKKEPSRVLSNDSSVDEGAPVQSNQNVTLELKVSKKDAAVMSSTRYGSDNSRGQDTHSDPTIEIDVKKHTTGYEKQNIAITET